LDSGNLSRSHDPTLNPRVPLAFARILIISMIYLWAAATHVLAQNARVLFSFNGTVGSVPIAPLISDAAGNFSGTTSRGGAYDGGTAFMIKRTPQGGWTGN